MSETTRYVQITLAIEEVGVLDSGASDNRYTTRMYSLSDPGGTLDGELELICTQDELERELKQLGAINITPPPAAKPKYVAPPSSGYKSATSTGHSKVVSNTSLKEVPSHISASSLVQSMAKETGSTSVFTALLGDLIDDMLRPQSAKKK